MAVRVSSAVASNPSLRSFDLFGILSQSGLSDLQSGLSPCLASAGSRRVVRVDARLRLRSNEQHSSLPGRRSRTRRSERSSVDSLDLSAGGSLRSVRLRSSLDSRRSRSLFPAEHRSLRGLGSSSFADASARSRLALHDLSGHSKERSLDLQMLISLRLMSFSSSL